MPKSGQKQTGDADPLLRSRRTPHLIPVPPPLSSPSVSPTPISVLLINLLVVVSPSPSSAVLIRLQLYLDEVGSWRLTAEGFPLSPAVGQWNYEHSSQSLYHPVLNLFAFRTKRNLSDHGDWSLRSLGFSPLPGKTDKMRACESERFGDYFSETESDPMLFFFLLFFGSSAWSHPGYSCINGVNIWAVKFVPSLQMAHSRSPGESDPSVPCHSKFIPV